MKMSLHRNDVKIISCSWYYFYSLILAIIVCVVNEMELISEENLIGRWVKGTARVMLVAEDWNELIYCYLLIVIFRVIVMFRFIRILFKRYLYRQRNSKMITDDLQFIEK
jgi:hypothetical protein